jgi:hypothetical protein
MAALVAAIHVDEATGARRWASPHSPTSASRLDVDGRHEAGHDGLQLILP